MTEKDEIDLNLHPRQEVINAFCKGDHSAFKQVFNFYYKSVYYFSKKLTANNEVAEEIASNSFLKLFERCIHFDKATDIKAFLFITARNNSIDYLRYSKRVEKVQREYAVKMQDEIHLPYEYEIMDELVERVRNAVNRLPGECCKIFKLLVYEELTPSEVAEILGISVNTVYVQRSRALLALRMVVKDQSKLLALLLVSSGCLETSIFHKQTGLVY